MRACPSPPPQAACPPAPGTAHHSSECRACTSVHLIINSNHLALFGVYLSWKPLSGTYDHGLDFRKLNTRFNFIVFFVSWFLNERFAWNGQHGAMLNLRVFLSAETALCKSCNICRVILDLLPFKSGSVCQDIFCDVIGNNFHVITVFQMIDWKLSQSL